MAELEVWLSVPGFSSYEASNLGNVRSLTRTVNCVPRGVAVTTRVRKGKVLKKTPNKGYLTVKLVANGKVYTFGVHQVVALAFHGVPPAGCVVDHVDTNKLNNRADNLEYVTNTENVKRQYKAGLLSNKAGEVGRWKHLKRV